MHATGLKWQTIYKTGDYSAVTMVMSEKAQPSKASALTIKQIYADLCTDHKADLCLRFGLLRIDVGAWLLFQSACVDTLLYMMDLVTRTWLTMSCWSTYSES